MTSVHTVAAICHDHPESTNNNDNTEIHRYNP